MIICVELINGFQGRGSDNRLEFPPSPGRLFSAIVSGAYKRFKSDNDSETYPRFPDRSPRTSYPRLSEGCRNALLHLESLPLPDIYYDNSVGGKRQTPTYMVPVNHPDGLKSFQQLGEKVEFRCHPRCPFVYFQWSDEMNDHWEVIAEVVRYVSYFGNPKSLAHLYCLKDLPDLAKNLRHIAPNEDGDMQLFRYYPGRLNDLDNFYDSSMPQSHPAARYGVVRERTKREDKVLKLFDKFAIFGIKGSESGEGVRGHKPLLYQGTYIADAVRARLLDNDDDVPTLIGKEKNVHIAQIPLPMVGSDHSDGHIMGIGIAIPPCSDFSECDGIVERLDGKEVRVGEYRWTLYRIRDENTSSALKQSTWCKESCDWASVTPLEVHSIHPKKAMKYRKKLIESMKDFPDSRWDELRSNLGKEKCAPEDECVAYILNHCRQMGLPEVEWIRVSHYPILKGSLHVRQFVSRNRLKDRPSGNLIHCELSFTSKVAGPLSLGRTRNYGGGLMKPMRAGKW